MKRAIRRHHRARLLKTRKDRLWWVDVWRRTDKFNYVANTQTRCSCTMCGNPRRHFHHIKKQEFLSMIDMMEQCAECDIYSTIRPNNIGRFGEAD